MIQTLATQIAAHSGLLLSYDIEPFLDYGTHAVESAYPHTESYLPVSFASLLFHLCSLG